MSDAWWLEVDAAVAAAGQLARDLAGSIAGFRQAIDP